jgi:NADH-quinone oxidoreductase subunit N
LSVLKVLVDVHMTWVAVIAVLFAVVGAFYYLRVVKVMYFDEAHEKTPALMGGFATQACFSINCFALLYFGLFPASLISLCSTVFMS